MADKVGGTRPTQESEIPLFGREDVRDGLEKAYSTVATTGEFQAVTVIGAPGLGKSLLLTQLSAWIRESSDDGARVYRSRARRQGLSYGVVARLLRARFEITEGDDEEATLARMSEEVRRVLGHDNVHDVCFFLGQLMGITFEGSPLAQASMSDDVQTEGMHRAVFRRFFEADSSRSPLCLIFDDLHFADHDSLALLRSLMVHFDGRILLVCSGDRELSAIHEEWEMSGERAGLVLEVEPLSGRASGEMIRWLLRRCDGGVGAGGTSPKRSEGVRGKPGQDYPARSKLL